MFIPNFNRFNQTVKIHKCKQYPTFLYQTKSNHSIQLFQMKQTPKHIEIKLNELTTRADNTAQIFKLFGGFPIKTKHFSIQLLSFDHTNDERGGKTIH